MSTRPLSVFALLLFAALALLPSPSRGQRRVRAAAAGPRFAVTEIASPGDRAEDSFSPMGLNNAGQVAGFHNQNPYGSPLSGPAVWKDGQLRMLREVPGFPGFAPVGINDSGAVLAVSAGDLRNFIWRDGAVTEIPNPANGYYLARAINNAGDVGGDAQIPGENGARAWIRVGNTSTLLSSGDVFGLSDARVAVGTSLNADPPAQPAKWENGSLTLLDPGQPGRLGNARAVNEQGQIVGEAIFGDGVFRAFLCDGAGGIRALPDPPVAPGTVGFSTWAVGINERGDIIGNTNTFDPVPCLWKGAQVWDLNGCIPASSGFRMITAVAINDAGWIVGTGSRADGSPAGLLLKPDGAEASVFDANIDYTADVQLPVPQGAAGQAALQRLVSAEWTALAKSRTRAAADGVTLLLLRVKLKASDASPYTFRLEGRAGEGDLGSLWRVDDPKVTDASSSGGARRTSPPGEILLQVDPVAVGTDRYAFALYRTPLNFDPLGVGETDPGSMRERNVNVLFGGDGVQSITIVRPLVIFQHGTFDYPEGWKDFPLYRDSSNEKRGFGEGAPLPFYASRTKFWDPQLVSAGPMLLNAQRILEDLHRRLDEWRSVTDTAATQADVVTHSFGGPCTRMATQLQSSSDPLTRAKGYLQFRSARNWGHGLIHKLICIAGTHRGSHIPNHLAYINHNSRWPGWMRVLTGKPPVTHPMDYGAVEDQFVLSPALKGLKETRVPGHAIVGSGLLEFATWNELAPFLGNYAFDKPDGPYSRAGSLGKWVRVPIVIFPRVFAPDVPTGIDWANFRKLTNYHFNLDFEKPTDPTLSPDYDLTVASLSMKGGMPRTAYSDVTDLQLQIGQPADLVGRVSHVIEETSGAVSQRVRFLLHRPVESTYFAYFPAVGTQPTTAEKKFDTFSQAKWLYESPKAGVKSPVLPWPFKSATPTGSAAVAFPQAAATAPTIAIDDPDGEVLPGQQVDVTVAWPGKTFHGGLLQWSGKRPQDGGMAPLDPGIPRFRFVVPSDCPPGPLKLTLLAQATDGTVEVTAKPVEALAMNSFVGLRVLPRALRIRTTGISTLEVYGELADGQLQDVTSSKRVTMTVGDPGVLQMTQYRTFIPVGIGSTRVTVSYAGVGSVEVPVQVSGTQVPVAVAPPSTSPLLLRSSSTPVAFAFLSTADFDARTIVPSSVKVGKAVPVAQTGGALLQQKDVNGDRKLDAVVMIKPSAIGLAVGPVNIPMFATTTDGAIVTGMGAATAR